MLCHTRESTDNGFWTSRRKRNICLRSSVQVWSNSSHHSRASYPMICSESGSKEVVIGGCSKSLVADHFLSFVAEAFASSRVLTHYIFVDVSMITGARKMRS